jgi:hypothetical protein
VVETILDSGSASHVVVKFYISNTVVAILSKDSEFTPGTSISGYTKIFPGLNLASSISGAQFTGTVSTAATLSGITAGQFLRSDQAASSAYAVTVGSLLVGSDLAVTTSSGDVSVRNGTSNKNLDLYINKGGVDTKAIGITGTTGLVTIPGALTVTGTLTATASSARYADLAERFAADATYTPGTVVELGGAKEITAAVQELSDEVFGVISTRAAYLMNSDAGSDITHPAVAVSGRVPVRVIGQVKKGDRLVSAGAGLARAASREEITAFNVIGRALEDKNTENEGTVEAIVKLNS